MQFKFLENLIDLQVPNKIAELEARLPSLAQFPHPQNADSDGLLAVGGDLLPGTLVRAYARGIFPWSVNPITWWSPDPRAVFDIDDFELPKRTRRYIRNLNFEITYDSSFREVIESCAKPVIGREENWISAEFIEAYIRLYELGLAHSVEARLGGRLVGGVYGVALGGFFAGESMFHIVSNASSAALDALMKRLKERGFLLFDTQVMNAHTKRLGAREIPRAEYLARLRDALKAECSFP